MYIISGFNIEHESIIAIDNSSLRSKKKLFHLTLLKLMSEKWNDQFKSHTTNVTILGSLKESKNQWIWEQFRYNLAGQW